MDKSRPTPTALARSINRNAGLHDITADETALQACRRAANRSWEHFPYYERRYGAEGWTFGFSDGAWMVTLCERGLPAAVEQIRWLGGLLSSRGMPQVLLEHHLRFLHEELTADGGRSDYCAVLKRCEHALRKARQVHIRDRDFHRLSQLFDSLAGRELDRVGAIVISAVADEAGGIDHAVTSLRSFLCDPGGFSPGWIGEVEKLVIEARSVVVHRP